MKKQKQSQSPVPPVNRDDGQLSFPKAIEALIGGAKIRRKEWNDLEEYGLLKDSYLTIHRSRKFHTWTVSEGDMSALDWVIV